MISSSQPNRFSGKIISRHQFLLILQAAIDSQSYRFARQAALTWLAIYPGDMGASLMLARALAGDEKKSQAVAIAGAVGAL
jgi:hypothetical protein